MVVVIIINGVKMVKVFCKTSQDTVIDFSSLSVHTPLLYHVIPNEQREVNTFKLIAPKKQDFSYHPYYNFNDSDIIELDTIPFPIAVLAAFIRNPHIREYDIEVFDTNGKKLCNNIMEVCELITFSDLDSYRLMSTNGFESLLHIAALEQDLSMILKFFLQKFSEELLSILVVYPHRSKNLQMEYQYHTTIAHYAILAESNNIKLIHEFAPGLLLSKSNTGGTPLDLFITSARNRLAESVEKGNIDTFTFLMNACITDVGAWQQLLLSYNSVKGKDEKNLLLETLTYTDLSNTVLDIILSHNAEDLILQAFVGNKFAKSCDLLERWLLNTHRRTNVSNAQNIAPEQSTDIQAENAEVEQSIASQIKAKKRSLFITLTEPFVTQSGEYHSIFEYKLNAISILQKAEFKAVADHIDRFFSIFAVDFFHLLCVIKNSQRVLHYDFIHKVVIYDAEKLLDRFIKHQALIHAQFENGKSFFEMILQEHRYDKALQVLSQNPFLFFDKKIAEHFHQNGLLAQALDTLLHPTLANQFTCDNVLSIVNFISSYSQNNNNILHALFSLRGLNEKEIINFIQSLHTMKINSTDNNTTMLRFFLEHRNKEGDSPWDLLRTQYNVSKLKKMLSDNYPDLTVVKQHNDDEIIANLNNIPPKVKAQPIKTQSKTHNTNTTQSKKKAQNPTTQKADSEINKIIQKVSDKGILQEKICIDENTMPIIIDRIQHNTLKINFLHLNLLSNIRDSNGNSIIHYSIYNNNTEFIQNVLNKLGDATTYQLLSMKNNAKIAPLTIIYEKKMWDMLKVLHTHGCDVWSNYKDDERNTALHIFLNNGMDEMVMSCLTNKVACERLSAINAHNQSPISMMFSHNKAELLTQICDKYFVEILAIQDLLHMAVNNNNLNFIMQCFHKDQKTTIRLLNEGSIDLLQSCILNSDQPYADELASLIEDQNSQSTTIDHTDNSGASTTDSDDDKTEQSLKDEKEEIIAFQNSPVLSVLTADTEINTDSEDTIHNEDRISESIQDISLSTPWNIVPQFNLPMQLPKDNIARKNILQLTMPSVIKTLNELCYVRFLPTIVYNNNNQPTEVLEICNRNSMHSDIKLNQICIEVYGILDHVCYIIDICKYNSLDITDTFDITDYAHYTAESMQADFIRYIIDIGNNNKHKWITLSKNLNLVNINGDGIVAADMPSDYYLLQNTFQGICEYLEEFQRATHKSAEKYASMLTYINDMIASNLDYMYMSELCSGNTLLHYFAMYNDSASIKKLLILHHTSKHSYINIISNKNAKGYTPVDVAFFANSNKAFKVMVSYDSTVLKSHCKDGYNYLHLGAEDNSDDKYDMLKCICDIYPEFAREFNMYKTFPYQIVENHDLETYKILYHMSTNPIKLVQLPCIIEDDI